MLRPKLSVFAPDRGKTWKSTARMQNAVCTAMLPRNCVTAAERLFHVCATSRGVQIISHAARLINAAWRYASPCALHRHAAQVGITMVRPQSSTAGARDNERRARGCSPSAATCGTMTAAHTCMLELPSPMPKSAREVMRKPEEAPARCTELTPSPRQTQLTCCSGRLWFGLSVVPLRQLAKRCAERFDTAFKAGCPPFSPSFPPSYGAFGCRKAVVQMISRRWIAYR